ncbi:MAG: flagellar protein FlaG [Pseudomonadales bacterium]
MFDVTATTTALKPERPATAVSASASGSAAGRSLPASGTTLPATEAREVKIPELPELERLAESLSNFARSLNRDLSFSVHEASGQMVVKVLDGETKEVIRQIPSEEFLRISESLASSGALLIDQQA